MPDPARRPRRLALAVTALAGVLVAALVLGACSSGGGGETPGPASSGASPAERVRAAPGVTRAAGTAAVSLAVDGGDGELRIDGVVDLEVDRARFSVDLGALGSDVDVILDGARILARVPSRFRPVLGEWTEAPLARGAALAGLDDEAARALEGIEPLRVLDLPRGADEVEEEGPEDVAGEPTTRYSAILDLDAATRAVPGEDAAAVARTAEALGTPRLPAEVWLDAEGRLRRLRFELGGGSSGAPATQVTVELGDFGVEADVTLPDPGDVSDLGKLLG